MPAPAVEVASPAFWQQVAFWAAVISLIWNFVNTARTETLQKRARLRATKLEEFRSQLRDPITSALRDLGAVKRELHGLALSASEVKERKEMLIAINQKFAVKFGELQDALASANASSFASGQHWMDDIGDYHDQCLMLIDRATSPTRPPDDFSSALALLIQAIAELISTVTLRLEQEVKRITDDKAPAK